MKRLLLLSLALAGVACDNITQVPEDTPTPVPATPVPAVAAVTPAPTPVPTPKPGEWMWKDRKSALDMSGPLNRTPGPRR